MRGGTGYSSGTGGTIRASLQADVNGAPSGVGLASVTWTPGNPSGNWENKSYHDFPVPYATQAGTLYHLVFANVDADPVANQVSINDAFTYDVTTPRQPAFSDDFGVLYDKGSGWMALPRDTPVMDLVYANGRHDGNDYFAVMSYYGIVSGSVNMAREHFTVSGGDRMVTTVSVRVKRISGASPLSIRLETGNGTEIETVLVDGAGIPRSTLPGSGYDANGLGGGRWLTATFAMPHTLVDGQSYNLRISTSSDSEYLVIPIREEDTEWGAAPQWGAYAFRDGSGQKTTNGSTWADLYPWAPVDLQFCFR